jgi:hypothetical protein
MSARFLVAKYIPDLRRMEPRNIGVIVWSDGLTHSQFLGDEEALPRYLGVKDKTVYGDWLQAWKLQLTKPALEVGRGEKVDRTTSRFVDALREWSRGNFLLVDGGELLDPCSEDNIEEVTQYLFAELVGQTQDTETRESEYQQLRTATAHLLKRSGLAARSDLRRDEPVWYRAFGVQKYFQCDLVLGPLNGPYSIYQRVPLLNSRTFDSTAFHLHWFRQSREYPKERCAGFILPPRGTLTNEQARNRDILEQLVTVIDVADEDRASVMLSQIASRNGHL